MAGLKPRIFVYICILYIQFFILFFAYQFQVIYIVQINALLTYFETSKSIQLFANISCINFIQYFISYKNLEVLRLQRKSNVMRYEGKWPRCPRGEGFSIISTAKINSAVSKSDLSVHLRLQHNILKRKSDFWYSPLYQHLSLSEKYFFEMSSLFNSIKNLAIGGNTNTLNGNQEPSIYLGWFDISG